MAVLLDTASLPRSDRAEAIDAAMRYATVPNRLIHEDPAGDLHARVDLWELGAASLLRQRGSGMRLTRTPSLLRVAAPERISLSLLTRGRWEYSQHGHVRRVDSTRPELVLTDLTANFDYNRSGEGGSHSFMVDFDELGMPVDAIRRAAPRLRYSPLYELLLDHVARLDEVAERVTGPARTMIGSATTELVRALIATVAEDEAAQREAMAGSLPTRITIYLQRHLTDPDLTPARVAHAHNISLRHLYNVWGGRDISLGEWIIRKRLETARRDLAKPEAQTLTIAAIAHRSGFADATHFSRRFRAEFGVSPREWRRRKQNDSGTGTHPEG